MTTFRAFLWATCALALFGCADALERIGDVDGTGNQGLGFIGALERGTTPEVTLLETVPYGSFARNCSVSKKEMGKEIGTASGYAVYDTSPDKLSQRTHFITGFRDGCARQFSGALVMFGDIGTHELVRYANVGLKQPYTAIDEAYEVIKGSFCRVKRTEPCGSRIDRLAKTTSFVTVYESFADNARWVDVLVHKGEIVATDVND